MFNPLFDPIEILDEAGLDDALGGWEDEPFYPLDAPGMPLPGPDFVAKAVAMGDPKPVIKGTKENKRLLAHGPILEKLYRMALYHRHFYLPVRVKGRQKLARFLPGHRWGEKGDIAGPAAIGGVDVLVLGKCLGQEEHRLGRNFAGATGAKLEEVLRLCGAQPHEYAGWYVSNLVRHENLDPSTTRLAASHVKNCAPLFEQELRLLRPRFVLCLGSEASAYVLGDEPGGLGGTQGMILSRTVPLHHKHGDPERYHAFTYMTCVHPAAVLHRPEVQPELVGTVRRFLQLVRGELTAESEIENPDHRVVYTEAELAQVVDDIIAEHARGGRPSQAVALDCEWHGDAWTNGRGRVLNGDLPDGKRRVPLEKGEPESWLRTIQFSHRPGFARCVVLRHGGRRHPEGDDRVGLPAFVPGLYAAVRQLKRLFTSTPDRHVRVVGHNLRADLPWLTVLDAELGRLLVDGFEAPADDPDPDGVTRKYGWQKAREYGGFDTLYGCHAHNETGERKLEVVALNLCGVRRYDVDVIKEKAQICSELQIKPGKLPGYGEISDDVLFKYGNWDADSTIRIFEAMVRPGGLLDCDSYGQNSWKPFWLSQRKMTAELEMEMTGLLIHHNRAVALMTLYDDARQKVLKKLSEMVGWPDFNPVSVIQTRTVLFGWGLSGKIDTKTGLVVDPRPPAAKDCVVMHLPPVKTSGKPSTPWEKVVRRNQVEQYTPSVDKEVLGILLARTLAAGQQKYAEIIKHIRWFRFLNRVLTGVLCPQDRDEPVYDEDGDLVFEKGFMSCVEWDRRVRTHFLPVDTGRVSSARPNIQNLSKRREADLRKIVGGDYLYPLRSIIGARPGYVIVGADFTGAELFMMAIQSGSVAMVDHCQRATLKEDHPDHFDIHTNVAVKAFQLKVETPEQAAFFGLPVGSPVPPRKSACGVLKRDELRDIAKTIAFGIPYGRGDDAVVRAVEELGLKISIDDVALVRGCIFGNYPELEDFFAACHRRVLRPGYMVSCFGRLRRFQDPGDSDQARAEMERQAGNFPIQGGVADCTTIACHNLRHYPGRDLPDGTRRYYLVAQVHDDLVSEVRIPDLEWYIKEVLPACLGEGVGIRACDLDGRPLPGRPVYHLGHEVGIYEYWGEKLTYERAEELGVPEAVRPKKKVKPT